MTQLKRFRPATYIVLRTASKNKMTVLVSFFSDSHLAFATYTESTFSFSRAFTSDTLSSESVAIILNLSENIELDPTEFISTRANTRVYKNADIVSDAPSIKMPPTYLHEVESLTKTRGDIVKHTP